MLDNDLDWNEIVAVLREFNNHEGLILRGVLGMRLQKSLSDSL